MNSRLRTRESVKKLFHCFMTVEPLWTDSDDETVTNFSILQVYPKQQSKELLESAANFCYPCKCSNENVELFTFVLTRGDSKWMFGFCRRPVGAKSSFVVLSFLPWQEVFYRVLNLCAEMKTDNMMQFLEDLYNTTVPPNGTCLCVPTSTSSFICASPLDYALPSIPENRNVNEFYNALQTESMIKLFAALLSERRIVITSKRLSRLSSIVMACNSFLFPMSWQHIFIPVLPRQLQDYLTAPMPFLIGVPSSVWNSIPPDTVGSIVKVDSDTDFVDSPFPEDVSSMPEQVLQSLRKNLSRERVLGDGLAKAFLRALAQLMGHYHDAISQDGELFDKDMFINSAHPSYRKYLRTKMLNLQIFHQFIEERKEKIRCRSSESDEFELECLAWRSERCRERDGLPVLRRRLNYTQNRDFVRKASRTVMSNVKREGGQMIDNVKQNSTIKSAYRSMKESTKTVKQKGKIVCSDIKAKLNSSAIRFPSHTNSATHGSKVYNRCAGSTSHSSLQVPRAAHLPVPDTEYSYSTNKSVQFETLSCSDILPTASTSPSFDTRNVVNFKAPRLSRSEENLIDLDSPTDNHFHLFKNNNEPVDPFDQDVGSCPETNTTELLKEYGLEDCFKQLNLKERLENCNSATTRIFHSEDNFSKTTKVNGEDNWTTFD